MFFYLPLTLPKNHENDFTWVLTQFLISHKLGDVLWSQQEKQILTLGLVMRKENAGETMKKIKEHPEIHRDKFCKNWV